ncbi:MAG: flavodoxin family protein [Armatimonadota bacterium]
MSSITIAYHSGYGHTKKVAEAVAGGVGSVPGVTVTILDVTKVEESIGEFASGWEALQASDGILFGTPTYMAGPSAPFKTFADATVKIWFERKWKDKVAGGFTNSGSNAGDKGTTLSGLFALAAQHEMIWVTLGVRNDGTTNRNGYYQGLGTQSDNASPEETPNAAELDTSRQFGVRFGEAVNRWVKGA